VPSVRKRTVICRSEQWMLWIRGGVPAAIQCWERVGRFVAARYLAGELQMVEAKPSPVEAFHGAF